MRMLWLVRIDPRDYETALAQARAQVAQDEASIANLVAQIDAQMPALKQAQEQVRQTQAALGSAQEENARAQELFKSGVGTQQRATAGSLQSRSSEAAFAAAQGECQGSRNATRSSANSAEWKTAGRRDQARAVRSQAETNLSRTAISAPVVSRVTKLSAAKGNYTNPGKRC